ncbi:nucleoredoxin-like [Halichondria panicea]|uniref:nucleoredoxin-like n=1 Tax=Halichondria panicea TaxID=6063 RepID=UPI00312BAF31
MNKLLGDTIIRGNGDEVAVSTLEGEGKVVALYFSAHWCPPCRSFTPQLATWYKGFKKGPNGDKFEIVFVSSDRDDASFKEYFNEMPWLALPFVEREKKAQLSTQFKVSGIPTLVMLNAANGKLITSDGRAIVTDDAEGKDFPWTPKPFLEVVEGKFYKKNGKEVEKDVEGLGEFIKEKIIGLYFSAHWCGPCRGFTPQLVKTYNKLKEDGKKFEIIFVSSDRDEDSFMEYYGEMPWISIPHGDPRKKTLSRMFDVSGIPTLVILDENKQTITSSGRAAISSDPEGKEFPWYPKPINQLTGATAGDINDSPALIWFNDKKSGKDLTEVMKPVADEWIKKWKDAEETQAMVFYVTGNDVDDDEGIANSLKQFASITSNTELAIVDIPTQKVYESSDTDVDTGKIRSFVEGFLNKTLKGRGLRH